MFTKEFLDKLSKKIEKIEDESSVELVIAVSPASGNYRDIDAQNGFFTAIAMLLVTVYSPWDFQPELLATILIMSYLVGLFISSKQPFLKRVLTSKARQCQQAKASAESVFVRKKVSCTRARSGLLLYLSYTERTGVFIPDVGIEAVLPRATFNDIEAGWQKSEPLEKFEQSVLDALDKLLAPLKQALPHPTDDSDELPNEIHILSEA